MFVFETKLRFFDCDPAGIIFYGRIFELCHAAYEELINGMGLRDEFWSNDTYAVPITKTEAQFFKPMRYGRSVRVALTIRALTDTSFDVHYECSDEAGVVWASAKTSHVVVDRQTFKRSAMKPALREGLAAHAT